METKLVNYDFDQSFKSLSEQTKEIIALGSWSMYKLTSNHFLIVTDGGCPCCHGSRQKAYYLTNEEGVFLDTKDKIFFDEALKNNEVSEVVRMQVPERLSKNYIKFSLK